MARDHKFDSMILDTLLPAGSFGAGNILHAEPPDESPSYRATWDICESVTPIGI